MAATVRLSLVEKPGVAAGELPVVYTPPTQELCRRHTDGAQVAHGTRPGRRAAAVGSHGKTTGATTRFSHSIHAGFTQPPLAEVIQKPQVANQQMPHGSHTGHTESSHCLYAYQDLE
jgi:hypothetical protein